MQETILNKVADSGIITINLEDYYPKETIAVFDLKDYLFMKKLFINNNILSNFLE